MTYLVGGQLCEVPIGSTAIIGTTTVAAAAAMMRGGAITAPRIRHLGRRAQKPKMMSDGLKSINNLWFEDIQEPFRFFVSGLAGTLCFFLLEWLVNDCISAIKSPPIWLEEHKESISFFLGYILQIITQHLLHALLVYGLHTIDTREKYVRTLMGQTGAYFISLVGSTILNTYLRRKGVQKNSAFVSTLCIFACINYFVIGWVVRSAVKTAEEHQMVNCLQQKKTTVNLNLLRGGAVQSTQWHCRPCPLPRDDRKFGISFLLSSSPSVVCVTDKSLSIPDSLLLSGDLSFRSY